MSQKLYDNIALHSQVPQRISKGRAGLVDKVGAHVLSLSLESGVVEQLSEAVDSYLVWCADMGVEIVVPDVQPLRLADVWPDFCGPTGLTSTLMTARAQMLAMAFAHLFVFGWRSHLAECHCCLRYLSHCTQCECRYGCELE